MGIQDDPLKQIAVLKRKELRVMLRFEYAACRADGAACARGAAEAWGARPVANIAKAPRRADRDQSYL